jgi:ATP-dependent DNA helicase RecQ
VIDNIPSGPVLLIDDVVDSGWTMTVIAALLRRAGSGAVWPVALATTSAGD